MRLWVIALLLLAPAASAAPVDLYVHLDGFSEFPINTQVPQADGARPTSIGVTLSGCVPDEGQGSIASRSMHTWYAFSTPGAVVYDAEEEQPRIHFLRLLGSDLHLDGVQPVMTWHLAATGPQGLDDLAPMIPNVILRVHVRAGNAISVGNSAFDSGPLVAMGEVGPVTLHPAMDHPQITARDVAGHRVYSFAVPLELHNQTILQNDGFNIRIDAMMDNPHCTQSSRGGYIMPDLVRPFHGEGLWNHLHVGVVNAIEIQSVHVQLLGQEIVIHAAGQSPFGPDDVAQSDWLDITGPSVLPATRLNLEEPYHGHQVPSSKGAWSINITEAPHGIYTARILLANLQGTANATAMATFEIGDRGVRICQDQGAGHACTLHGTNAEVPGLPLAWLLAALVLGRRR